MDTWFVLIIGGFEWGLVSMVIVVITHINK